MLDSLRAVNCMQVEDSASVRLLCPGQEALIIALNKANRSVDQFHPIFAKVVQDLIEESLQHRFWDIDLGNDLSRGVRGVEFLVDFAMVVVGVDTQLMGV